MTVSKLSDMFLRKHVRNPCRGHQIGNCYIYSVEENQLVEKNLISRSFHFKQISLKKHLENFKIVLNAPFLYPLKISENLKFFRKSALGTNGFIKLRNYNWSDDLKTFSA